MKGHWTACVTRRTAIGGVLALWLMLSCSRPACAQWPTPTRTRQATPTRPVPTRTPFPPPGPSPTIPQVTPTSTPRPTASTPGSTDWEITIRVRADSGEWIPHSVWIVHGELCHLVAESPCAVRIERQP